MADSTKQLLDRHRELSRSAAANSRAIAEIESKLIRCVPASVAATDAKGWQDRLKWLADLVGDTIYNIRGRRELWLLDDLVEPLWELVAQGTMPIGTARRIAHEVRRRVGKNDRDAFAAELRRALGRQGYAVSSEEVAEPIPLPPEEHEWDDQREFWARLTTSLTALANQKLKGLPEHERDLMVSELSRDISATYQTHMQRWNRLLKTQREAKRISRSKLRQALLMLHMDPPRRGTSLDALLAKAKSQKKQLARMYHPDTNRGADTRAQFQAVLDAFCIVEQYVNENKEAEVRPPLRVVPGGKGQ